MHSSSVIAEPLVKMYLCILMSEFVCVCVRFAVALNAGLLEVIVPSPQYYPNFDTLQDTFGDTMERVRQDVVTVHSTQL